MYDNSEVDLTKPVQVGITDVRDGIIDWYEAVVSEDGKTVSYFFGSREITYLLSEIELRNVPTVTKEELDDWYVTKIGNVFEEYEKRYNENNTRWANMKYKG